MAVTGLIDSAYLNNAHVQAFTVSGVDLTGRVVKWAMALINPRTLRFDPSEFALVKSNQVAGDMTLLSGPNGEIDVNLFDEDTEPGKGVGVGDYHFQLEVFDAGGDNGVVVSEGVLTLKANIQEA